MSIRLYVGSAAFSFLALCFALASGLQAQDLTQPEIENSKYQFTGVVNSNAVYVRSGPSENDYPTAKLDKGAEVTVVGLRFEWLKVVPPEGSFCYVAKAFVERRGAGSTGRVTSTLNVRVGSQLNELKAKIGSKLEPGADVEIIGEEQEYFKIKPPQGVYFYVNKQFVDPVKPLNLAEAAPPDKPTPLDEPETTTTPDPANPSAQGITDSALSGTTTSTPTAPPAVAPAPAPTPEPTPTVRASAEAEAEFERLEKEYGEASLKPLDQQPVQELLDGYQKLAVSDTLPESLRRIADFKVEVLKSRLETQQQFADTRKAMDDMKQKHMALDAERQELEQRVKDTQFDFYTAVGTLRPSSLQMGSGTIYRLTDPSNGRTLVYLRTDDTKIAAMIGQFIGVKGEVQSDEQMNLRFITPTTFEMVNPAWVGQSVAAQFVPPSLLPSGATAQTD